MIGSEKEYPAFRAVWSQGGQLLKDATFYVMGIRWFGMARPKQGPFMSTVWGGGGGGWEVEREGEGSTAPLINPFPGHWCCPDGGFWTTTTEASLEAVVAVSDRLINWFRRRIEAASLPPQQQYIGWKVHAQVHLSRRKSQIPTAFVKDGSSVVPGSTTALMRLWLFPLGGLRKSVVGGVNSVAAAPTAAPFPYSSLTVAIVLSSAEAMH